MGDVEAAKLPRAARTFAMRHHEGQTDKLGRPYSAHIIHVGESVRANGVHCEAIGYLHDVVEDCDVRLDDISSRFGPTVAAGVDAMTKRDGEDYETKYMLRLMQNPLACVVKFADSRHNFGKLHLLKDDAVRQRLFSKYSRVFEQLTANMPELANWSAPPDLVFEQGRWRSVD